MLRECISWVSVTNTFTHVFFSVCWSIPWLSLALILCIQPPTENALVRVQQGVELYTFSSSFLLLLLGVQRWLPKRTGQELSKPFLGILWDSVFIPLCTLASHFHWQLLQSQETIFICSFLLDTAFKERRHLAQGGRWCCLKHIIALPFKNSYLVIIQRE